MVCGASVWYMQHCGIFLIVRGFSLFRRLAAVSAASVSESASASSSSSSARCPGGPGGEPPSVIEDLRAQRRVHQHPAHIPRITHSRDQAPRAKRSMPLQASLAPWLSRLSKFLLSQNGLRPVNVFKDPWNPRLAATRVPKGQGPRAISSAHSGIPSSGHRLWMGRWGSPWRDRSPGRGAPHERSERGHGARRRRREGAPSCQKRKLRSGLVQHVSSTAQAAPRSLPASA